MFKVAEPGQRKAVFFSQSGNSINLGRQQVPSQRKILRPSFQGQDHGFCHAGKTGVGREAEIKTEVHVPGNMDHTAFNYQHIVPHRRYIPGYIAGTGHIADHGTGFQIGRIDDKIYRAGHPLYAVPTLYPNSPKT